MTDHPCISQANFLMGGIVASCLLFMYLTVFFVEQAFKQLDRRRYQVCYLMTLLALITGILAVIVVYPVLWLGSCLG